MRSDTNSARCSHGACNVNRQNERQCCHFGHRRSSSVPLLLNAKLFRLSLKWCWYGARVPSSSIALNVWHGSECALLQHKVDKSRTDIVKVSSRLKSDRIGASLSRLHVSEKNRTIILLSSHFCYARCAAVCLVHHHLCIARYQSRKLLRIERMLSNHGAQLTDDKSARRPRQYASSL